jgi:hypothetical protein
VETLIAYLESLKNSVPVNCTLFNLQRLKINWIEFKTFLSSLPEHFAELKNIFLERLEGLKIKIDAIDGFFRSRRKARFAFQEATMQIKAEMDAAISRLQSN